MSAVGPVRDLATAVFEAKRQRRLDLARLPIERKLEVLLDLQRIANDVRRVAGRPPRAEWPRSAVPPEPNTKGSPDPMSPASGRVREDGPDFRQVEAFRAMSPAERWKLAGAMLDQAVRLRSAGIRMQHPDWAPARVEAEVRQELLRART